MNYRSAADEEYPFDIGQRYYTRDIKTTSSDAQKWFDRGLCQCYGFNHEEGIRCARRAVEADPNCLLGHWLIAFCCAPNYNKYDMNDPSHVEVDGQAHLDTALILAAANDADPAEVALVRALEKLLRNSDGEHVTGMADDSTSDYGTTLPMYRDAMEAVYTSYPDDPDVACQYAQAMMNLRPWSLFVMAPSKDGSRLPGDPEPGTLKIHDVLRHALAAFPNHVGLRHLWIHATEMGPSPGDALDPGRPGATSMFDTRMEVICPDAGHLVHMVSHADVLNGYYQDSMAANALSQEKDQKYVQYCRKNGLHIRSIGFYTVYRCHSVHFLMYSAMMCGQYTVAKKAALDLIDIVSETRKEEGYDFGGAGFLAGFVPMILHVYIRFGRWDDILAHNVVDDYVKNDAEFNRFSSILLHYARGIANAVKAGFAKCDKAKATFLARAKAEQAAFENADPFGDDEILMNNPLNSILAVASKMLAGELHFRTGPAEEAFDLLHEAVALEEGLGYDEPWGWMQPVRHAIGALMLEEAGRSPPDKAADLIARAEKAYRDDLSHPVVRAMSHPDNVWALTGLAECLEKQGKPSQDVRAKTKTAAANAEVKVSHSCLCRAG